jgi:hypothetical protein
VLVPLVDLQPERGSSGSTESARPGVDEQLQARPREAAEQQLGQLVRDPLDADDLQPTGHRPHRLDHLRRDGEAELAGEAARPQHAQRVVAEGVLRPAGVRSRWAARSSSPPYGSTKASAARQSGSATAMALTAKSRRARSSPSESP